MIVGRIRSGLKHETVFATYVFLYLNKYFLIREALHICFAQGNVELFCDLIGKFLVRVAGKKLHIYSPEPRPLSRGAFVVLAPYMRQFLNRSFLGLQCLTAINHQLAGDFGTSALFLVHPRLQSSGCPISNPAQFLVFNSKPRIGV